jgi:anti-anti-sigma factor
MFTAENNNEVMVINAINTHRISFQNIDELRNLINQTLENPCNKIILDLQGVKFIDSASFATIGQLIKLSNQKRIDFAFANIDSELKELFSLALNL